MEPFNRFFDKKSDEQRAIEAQSARLGLLVIAVAVSLLPLVLALYLAMWSLAFAAWHLLLAQLGG